LAGGAWARGAASSPLSAFRQVAGAGRRAAFVPASTAVSWPLLGLFAVLQCGRIWVIASLGRYWTARLIVVPDHPLVTTGAYRFLRHPNYLIVIAEIAVLPLAFGAVTIAAVFSAANLALIARRIAIEERALAPRRIG